MTREMAWRERAVEESPTPAGERTGPSWQGEQAAREMVHALKNSLTSVKVLVQLGLRNPAESASHARFALMEREFARMQDILQRLRPDRAATR